MTNNEIKQILDNAPEGATHVESFASNNYWNLDKFELFNWDTQHWEKQYSGIHPSKLFRSLADIRRIVELESALGKAKKFTDFQSEVVANSDDEINQKDKRIAELEQALPLIRACYETVRHGGDFDGFDLERELVECGIIEGVPYEPEKHSLIGGEFDLEEGETIYFLTDFWCEILNKQAEEL